MINIQDIIPFMKKGWVAMESDGTWVWWEQKPERSNCWWTSQGLCYGLVEFDIAPADDWTKSLIKVDGK